MDHHAHIVANSITAAGIVAVMAGWLPPVAALLGIVWYLVQIYESATFKRVWEATRNRFFR